MILITENVADGHLIVSGRQVVDGLVQEPAVSCKIALPLIHYMNEPHITHDRRLTVAYNAIARAFDNSAKKPPHLELVP